jgi:hypothetical protein
LVTGLYEKAQEHTLRKPENTSLFRAMTFNKTNVMEFFHNYMRALKAWKYTADRVYNIDKTGESIVVQSPNIVAQIGTKQVGVRGTMITVCVIINSVGYTVPPVFIFPRARLHDSLMLGVRPGSMELVSSPHSSWITGPLFLKVL